LDCGTVGRGNVDSVGDSVRLVPSVSRADRDRRTVSGRRDAWRRWDAK
jgi:hypothetical protein